MSEWIAKPIKDGKKHLGDEYMGDLIRCKDCKYKDDGIDEDGIPFLKCLNGRSYGGTRINDYCSWAERRKDNG